VKMTAPCSIVEVDRRFRGAFCFHHDSLLVNGDSTHLWNVGILQWYYTVLYLRKVSSS
jgi:hypothetical protein